AWLDSGKHVKGEEGDVTVLFRRGGGRVSMFPGRFGTLGDCAPVCESWQYVVYPCASNQDGTVTFCDAWVCAKWVETCLPA
ncbi:MAG: hypothetical protein ABMB14_27035, partial [Myxococcota bacterium]